jgi:hypothetical protein
VRIKALIAFYGVACLEVGTAPICAETVSIQHGEETGLTPFKYTDLPQGGRVDRICYDGANKYLLFRVGQKYRQYCEIESAQ